MAAILMPKLSDSMEEGTIVRWLVEDGVQVGVGDELVEIETDKAVMIYEAEAAGTVRFSVAEGDSVPVGSVIAHLLAAGQTDPEAAAAGVGGRAGAQSASNSGAALATSPSGQTSQLANGRGAADGHRSRARVNASPVARRIADVLGVELQRVAGSGPAGRIVKRDVEVAVASIGDGSPFSPPRAPVTATASAAESAVGALAATGKGNIEMRDLSRIQATIARRMSEAKATIPEFTLSVDVDMEAAVEFRDRLKGLGEILAPSYNDFVVKAAALALRAYPLANGAYRDGRFQLYDRVNIGVAVAAKDALLVPTVMDADRCSLGGIAAETRRLAEAARNGQLTATDLSNGTFTVSNLGMFGIRMFTAVLNPPQAAILAVGALERRPVVREDELVAGHRMTITLSCDHRILYGADAAQFLSAIRTALEQPFRLVL